MTTWRSASACWPSHRPGRGEAPGHTRVRLARRALHMSCAVVLLSALVPAARTTSASRPPRSRLYAADMASHSCRLRTQSSAGGGKRSTRPRSIREQTLFGGSPWPWPCGLAIVRDERAGPKGVPAAAVMGFVLSLGPSPPLPRPTWRPSVAPRFREPGMRARRLRHACWVVGSPFGWVPHRALAGACATLVVLMRGSGSS
jgi:hypothetical protein